MVAQSCEYPEGFPGSSAGKESACNTGDPSAIPGSGRSPGEGKGYPLQYSGLESSMNCTVHGVAKSQTERLSLVFVNKALLEHSHTHSLAYHLWLLSLTTAELSGCQGTHWAAEADVFTT